MHQANNERKLMKTKEAAAYLAISERTLWTLTQEGQIPAVRIKRSVRYDPHDLFTYVREAKGEHRD